MGAPARPKGHVCDCGERLAAPTAACARCGSRYRPSPGGGLERVGEYVAELQEAGWEFRQP